jgi:hypothetical protein
MKRMRLRTAVAALVVGATVMLSGCAGGSFYFGPGGSTACVTVLFVPVSCRNF